MCLTAHNQKESKIMLASRTLQPRPQKHQLFVSLFCFLTMNYKNTEGENKIILKPFSVPDIIMSQ